MIVQTLQSIFERDLKKLYNEISLYKNENVLWQVSGDVSNAAGNLCLHLVGNLSHFIGKEIGGTGYVRNREQEFALKDIPRETLLKQVTEVKEVVRMSLSKIKDDDLAKEYPLKVFEEKMSTGYFLVHLATHLSYHLGQINYHRRMMDVEK